MGYKSIGRQLQLAREQAGYSQEQLAAKVGCSQATLSNYEKGKRRVYLTQLENIAEVLNKPIEFFLNPVEHDRVNQQTQEVEEEQRDSCRHEGEYETQEQAMVSLFREVSPEGKKLLIDFALWLKKREVDGNGRL